MGRRFAIVIGIAAAGVTALGAQPATATSGRHFQGAVEGGGRVHFDTEVQGGKNRQVVALDITQVPVSCDDMNGLLNLQILDEPGPGIAGTQVVGDIPIRVEHRSFRFTPEDQPGGQTISFRGKFNRKGKKATGTYRAQGDLFLGPVYKTGGVMERTVGTPTGGHGWVAAHNCDTGTVEWSARKRTPTN